MQSDPGAIDAVRAGVLKHLEAKALNPNTGKFSGGNLNKAVEAIGDTKLQLIFGPERAGQIKSFARAAVDATVEPAYSAVNHSNTAPMLLSAIEKSRMVPGVPLLVSDEVKSAAQANAIKKQLADALAARAKPKALPLNPRVQSIVDALVASSAPTSVAVTNQFRNQDKKRAGNQ
jgi:hypothetical protein